MIDIHSHILFSVDDGAKDVETSLKMIEAARKAGIKSLVLTPHVSKFRKHLKAHDVIKSHFDMLKKLVETKKIDIELYMAYEVDYHKDVIDGQSTPYTLNDSKYVLVDFTMDDTDILEAAYEMRVLGYKVIVAHPERIEDVTLELLYLLKKEGALFQVSANHLVGKGDKKACKLAKKLLKLEMIDFVASDAHEIDDLKYMKDAYDYVSKKKSKGLADTLFYANPLKVLKRETLTQ